MEVVRQINRDYIPYVIACQAQGDVETAVVRLLDSAVTCER